MSKKCVNEVLVAFLLLFVISCSNDEIVDGLIVEDVKISSFSSKTSNLALGRTAVQSSTAWEGDASRAVDGNTSGVWNDDSVTHTGQEYQPYWQVYLDEDTPLEEIVIWNRTNCCGDRLSNFDVFVYDSSNNLTYKETVLDAPNPSVTIYPGGAVGARVRIKLKDTNYLSLAEVQVYGTGTDVSSNGATSFSDMVGETIRIQSAQSNNYWLSISDTSVGTNLRVVSQSYTGNWPRWIVEEVVDGSDTYYRFVNDRTGARFRPDAAENNSPVYNPVNNWTGAWTQWAVESDGSGNYTLKNRATGNYLSSSNINFSTPATVSKLNGNATTWNLVDLSGNDINGESSNSGDSGVYTVEWQNWYLSVPIDREDGSGKATSIYYQDIEALNLTNEEKTYFNKNSDGSYKMNTRFTGFTTSGEYGLDEAKYCRTELREYYRGNQSTSDNWSMNSGTHIMESTLRVDNMGGDGRSYVGQIHGYPTDNLSGSPATVKVQWNNGDIVLEYYTADGISSGEWTSSNDVAVNVAEVGNEKFTIKVKIEDGKLYLAVICDAKGVDTGYEFYYDYDANGYEYDNYFKTGNYFKWNDDYTETSNVTLYGVSTSHY